MTALLVVLLAWQGTQPSIEGTAVRSTTNDPVAGARILVTKAGGEAGQPMVVRTDDRGRFLVRGITPGEYRLFAFHDDFVKTASPAIQIADGRPVPAVTLRLIPTGVITGRVLDEFNEPVAGAYVRARSKDGLREGRTNDLGEYRLYALSPGSYVVSAAPYTPPRIDPSRSPLAYIVPTPPSPYAPGEGQGMMSLARLLELGDFIHPMALRREGYARVYYPGTTDESAAGALDVAPGAVLAGIDLRTATEPAH